MTGVAGRSVRPVNRAVDPAVSVCVEASAGTGKTKVLVDRVLNLLLAGAAPSRLLCLTFTKAAAAEMANRLNEVLGRWTGLEDAALAKDLHDLTGAVAAEAMQRRARRLFAAVLDAPGGIRIQTIHAFCQSLLQRFPIEAGLAPHFQVLDERTAAEWLADARERVIEHAREGDDPALAAALAVVSGRLHEGQFAELMEALSRERARLDALILDQGGVDGLTAAIYRRLDLAPGLGEDEILAEAVADAAFDADALRRVAAGMLAGSATDRKCGAVLADWLAAPAQRRARLDDYCAVFLTGEGAVRRRLITKDGLAHTPGGDAILEAEARRLQAVIARCNAARIAAGTAALVRLGAALNAIYAQAKAAAAALDYDDLIQFACRLLDQPGIAPWVLYKLDGGIDHILIDEAQDTNPEQWAVIEAIAAEFFAGKGARDEPRTLFAVGDKKQSIYSFQRADPRVFGGMRDFIGARATPPGTSPVERLHVSYRSVPAVLRAVDAVFGHAPARSGVVERDETLRHDTTRMGEAGLVELWPPVEPRRHEPPAPWEQPTERLPEDSPPARLAKLIAHRIRTWLDTGERLESRGRPIRQSDIMILVRRRNRLVDELVRALKDARVEVAGVDRMVLADQLAVMDLIALGRFLLLPEDDLTLATALKGPLIGLGEDQLYALAQPRGEHTLWAELSRRRDEDPAFAAAWTALSALLAAADFMPPYELYADILGARGGRRDLVAHLGPEAEDPIDEFLAAALAFERNNTPALEAFLDWLEAGRQEIKRDLEQGGRDEVRVMTVHGAKGLQAPIVFLPDTMQVPTRSPLLLWPEAPGDGAPLMLWSPGKAADDPVAATARERAADAADEEYRRLLYVAMTRAADRLYVCGYATQRGVPEECWHSLVKTGLTGIAEHFRFSLRAGDEHLQGEGLRLVSSQDAPPRTDQAEAARPGPVGMPAWWRRPAPAEPVPPRPLVPSAPEEAEPPVRSPAGADDGHRFRRGRLIHRLLQSLPEVPAAERAEACRRFLARRIHGLDDAARAEIAAATLGVLDDPDFAPLFGPDSLAEAPVVGRIGARVISGQIDRLVVAPDRVLILDYKTQRPAPQRVADVPALYLRQMAAYRAALAAIYPGRRVAAALLWTDGPRLMALPDDLLDAHAPRPG